MIVQKSGSREMLGLWGYESAEEANIKMYTHMGFTTKIKDCYADPCAVDENMTPKPDEGFVLLSKRL